MAILSALALTFADWAKRVDPNGKIDVIINILSQTNEILDDMMVVEGNLPTGHRTTIRTGLPTATWRLLNYGVPTAKSTTAQITDSCGMLETYSVIDKALAELNGNSADFRLSEDLAFLEGMNQQMATAVFYSNALSTPAQIMGLSPRYNTVTAATAATAANVIDGGGTGSVNTSVWLLAWGANTIHGIFPKGSKAGLTHTDKGDIVPAYDANSNRYEAFTTHYKWDLGLTVRDWRYGVRICNVDTANLITGTGLNLINAMIRAIHRMPTQPAGAGTEQKTDAPDGGGMVVGRCAFYGNRLIRTYLDIQAANKANALLRIDEFAGKPRTSFLGIPVRTCDALLSTEARIT